MKSKTVTVCGSLRFWYKIAEVTELLELEHGYTVLGIVPHVLERDLTAEEKTLLGALHLKRIDLSDAIFVVNVDGYLGDAVKREIEYAKTCGKEIMYLKPPAEKEKPQC